VKIKITILIGLVCLIFAIPAVAHAANTNPVQTGSVGIDGTVASPPPTQAATITVPVNGQTFSSLPITVSGLCPKDTLVKVFKNNVFAGSAQCTNGSYSLKIDLFSGQNDLVARVYDALDQAGPDSPTVTVSFNDGTFGNVGSRVSITTNYAKRGANPGDKLTWPITISGGEGPYAISVDWGDGKTADLISKESAGDLTLSHIYDSPGVYNMILKVTDKNGVSAFLQLVGLANGALSQTNQTGKTNGTTVVTKTVTWPFSVLVPLLLVSFWLGKRHELYTFKKKLNEGRALDG
jgi:hypothetical protein